MKYTTCMAALLLAFAAAGCASFQPPVPDLPLNELAKYVEREHDLTLSGPWTGDQLKQLHLALHEQQKHIIKSIGTVTVRDDQWHYADPQVMNVAAHCHSGSGDLCFRTAYCTDYGIICHEAGHAYRFSLGDDCLKEWNEAAGAAAYGQCQQTPNGSWTWTDGSSEPRNGILTPYGGRNADEDIAEWYAACRVALRKDASSTLFRITASAATGYVRMNTGDVYVVQIGKHKTPPDARFTKKLALLKKWKFLTEDEHKRLEQYVK